MKKVKKYKAEPLDLMQYFYGSVHEPFIHGFVQLDTHLDEEALKKAVIFSLEAAPVLSCCFVDSMWHPYWKRQNFTAEDIVKIYNSENVEETGNNNSDNSENTKNITYKNQEELINRLLAMPIDIYREPQLKINVLRGDTFDTLCIIINHMVTDGVGFKEYLYLLCKLYTKLEGNPNFHTHLKTYPRSSMLLFKNFTLKDKLQIVFSKYDYTKQNQQSGIYLEGNKTNPFFITCPIGKEEFALMKAYAKKKGYTVNDLFVTSYARLLHKKAGMDRSIIPCPVNLRKYLNNGQKHGISNFISYYYCDLSVQDKDTFPDTLAQVSRQMNLQKDNLNSMKSLLMLEAAFWVIPFYYLKKHFLKTFSVPMFSITNLGIIDDKLLKFGSVPVKKVFLTATVKYVPYNQIVISTYDDGCTLSCNLYGTASDKTWIKDFVEGMITEIVTEVSREV